VLGKLLNTVRWFTFCVSFIRVLTILGWLHCFKIFKIDYLVTSNVQFGTVSINPVTNTCRMNEHKALAIGNYIFTPRRVFIENLNEDRNTITEYLQLHLKTS